MNGHQFTSSVFTTYLVSRAELQKDILTNGRSGPIWARLITFLEPEFGPCFPFCHSMLY